MSAISAYPILTSLAAGDELVVNNSGTTKKIDFTDFSGPLTTFTPTLEGLTTPGTPTYSINSGSFVRDGRQIMFQARCQLTAKGGMVGAIKMDISGIGLSIGGGPTPVSVTPIGGINMASGSCFTAYAQAQEILFREINGNLSNNLIDTEITDTFDVIVGGSFIVT